MSGLFDDLAAAYVRGSLLRVDTNGGRESAAELMARARAAGLRLNRFKRTMGLPRVRAVLGALRGIGPASLLDIGSGRGVFLWPLLDEYPDLPVTALKRDDRRRGHLEAVHRGGIERLSVVGGEASALPFQDAGFDVVTVLEVLEHQDNPEPLAREAVRAASRFVIASVPSKADDNPEHVQLFTGESLARLLTWAGARRVRIDYVPGHIIAVAAVADAA